MDTALACKGRDACCATVCVSVACERACERACVVCVFGVIKLLHGLGVFLF